MTSAGAERALFSLAPGLERAVHFAPLALLPTPVEEMASLSRALGAAPLWQKRDDLTSPLFGGNKVRTLEVLLGQAAAAGKTHAIATGAYGSNHAAATAIHAPRLGLLPGALLYPQPWTAAARDNLRVVLGSGAAVHDLPHWSALPLAMALARRSMRRSGERAMIMVPGGAVPFGALGYVSAALELAQQVARGQLPEPAEIVVATGSNCTTAGLLVGLAAAARFGIGCKRRPMLVGVRVTPWPVTSRWRIAGLAAAASALLARWTGDSRWQRTGADLCAGLALAGDQLGSGYGLATAAGDRAARLWRDHGYPPLDPVYSAKSAAALVARAHRCRGPLLYWATKSSAPLPPIDAARLDQAPPRMRRWLEAG